MAQYSSVPLDPPKGQPLEYTQEVQEVRDSQSQGNSSFDNSGVTPSGAPWQPGLLRRFPTWASAALTLVIAMAAGMGIVLAIANGKTADWKVSPTVLLAGAAAIANAMSRFALTEGVAVSWWKKATSPNTRMEDLHHVYSFGEDLTSVLVYLKAFNFVALASVAVSILPINGLLLQQASTIHSITKIVPFSMTIPLAQQVPSGYTGIITSRSSAVELLTSNFTEVVQDYTTGTSQNLSSSSCHGRCSGIVQAAGYAIKCTNSTVPFNMSAARFNDPDYSGRGDLSGPSFFYTSFDYNITKIGNYSTTNANALLWARMTFSGQFKDGKTCAGNIQVRNCTIEPALLKQHVILENQTLVLDPDKDYTSDEVVQSPILVNDRTVGSGRAAEGVYSTHGGMGLYLKGRFNAQYDGSMDGLYGLQVFPASGPANIAGMEYMTSAGGMGIGNARCNITWRDPTPNMMAAVRELAFRVSVKAADSTNATNRQFLVDGQESRDVLVYKSDFLFLGLAIMVTMIGLLCVLPTFRGWWNLGRAVSMNPLEIAKAFNGVRMEHADTNANINTLLSEVGKVPVRYGAVTGNKLMMGDPVEVMEIQEGTIYR